MASIIKSPTVEGKPYYQSLLEKYKLGTASAEEQAELFEELDRNEDTEEWEVMIRDQLSQDAAANKGVETADYDRERWQLVFQRILIADTTVNQPGRLLWLTRRRVAAAVILLVMLTGGGYIWRRLSASYQGSPGLTRTPADIQPGSHKAILTLAGGQKMILDSAGAGQLSIQGNSEVIKTNGAQLVYRSMGNTTGTTVLYNTMSTPRGGQYKLVLPDGTAVWLNAASSITYPTVFIGKERKVSVTGEAYFEVAPSVQPFRVNVNNSNDIEVLGTHFNVNAYSDEPAIRTTLLEGRIRVRQQEDSILLKPGQQAQGEYTKGRKAKLIRTEGANLEQVMAWKNGLFNFEGASLGSVMRQLGRWYDVDVIFEGTTPERTFIGEMSMDLNLSQVLKLLEKMQVRCRLEGRRLIVSQ